MEALLCTIVRTFQHIHIVSRHICIVARALLCHGVKDEDGEQGQREDKQEKECKEGEVPPQSKGLPLLVDVTPDDRMLQHRGPLIIHL